MKTIHYPGNFGQRCQAKYAIAADTSEAAGFAGRTTILFVADEHNPGGTVPNFDETADYLLNKVLDQELVGCRLEFIDVYYAGPPDAQKKRDVYRWNFKPDLFEPRTDDPKRTVSTTYRSVFDRIKAGFNIPSAKFEERVAVDNPTAGIYPVHVADHQPEVSESERLEILNRFGVLAR
jgi:hypothetical protein